jgi:hypothetical protein
VAALFGFLTAVIYLHDPRLGGFHDKPADIVLALVACVPVALRRRFPLPTFAVTTAAIAVLLDSGHSLLPLSTMLALVGYMVASRAPVGHLSPPSFSELSPFSPLSPPQERSVTWVPKRPR